MPDEIQFNIFKFCDLNTKIKLSQMNKQFFEKLQKLIFYDHKINFNNQIRMYKIHLTKEIKNEIDITDNDLLIIPNIEILKLDSHIYFYFDIRLQEKKITDNGIKNLPQLNTLNLYRNTIITNEGIQNLLQLTTLDLSYNNIINDNGIKNLLQLNTLILANNYNITKIKHLINLTNLDLSGYSIIDDIELKNLTKLTILNLENNNSITNEGLKYVPNLIELNLTNNKIITNEGLKHLHNLQKLNLTNNNTINIECVKYLPNLIELISCNKTIIKDIKHMMKTIENIADID